MTQFAQFGASGLVARLGPVSQGEQGLVATRRGAGAGDVQDFFRRQIGSLAPARRLREHAVMTHIAAEPGQGDEHLGGIGDDLSVALVPQFRGALGQRVQVVKGGERQELSGILGRGQCSQAGQSVAPHSVSMDWI